MDEEGLDPIEKLKRELEREREEKEDLAAQYRNLLAKLTTMRTSLGNKLRQDAEELDRREQLVQHLTAQNEDLVSTVETLKAELIASHEEAERNSKELDTIRSQVLNENAQESLLRERELRETLSELERCRLERGEWERASMQEKMLGDEARLNLETLRRDLEMEREVRARESVELVAARETATNLQSVLEDFSASKEHELSQAVKDYRSQLDDVVMSLAEFKRRALDAEAQLDELKINASRTQELEQDIKEKNLLIGKLRHEAVIINEHLMEALRRLRRNSSDTNVDRRLVNNVLLSFLSTPRADAKRFEMLTLLASVLSWTDAEREKAGLQRSSITASSGNSFWGRPSNIGSPSQKAVDLEKTDETESFSRLWVEYLLTEANQGETPTRRLNASVPSSPLHSPNSLSSPTGLKGTRRLASFTGVAGVASSPSLVLPPSRKGKEKEVVP
jgi:outer membrane murein-binding lipoprotein Lpp